MASRTKRECPIEGCTTEHSRDLMMCPVHWYRLTKELRDRVYRVYRQHGVLSEEYIEVREEAIEAASAAPRNAGA